MKKIINDPKQVVSQMLQGIAKSNPDVILLDEAHVIARRSKAPKVGLVSGGGSGHEPAHAGYVGKGMLDAAVAGNVFSSPDPERVLSGIMEADTGKGVLLVIKNYSGDVMNFTMAAELAEAEGHSVEYVVVKDDVAVPDSTYSTGRRGIAGTVFVHKIAGAMAERGASLAQVKRVAAKCIANVHSIGMALDACTLPEVGLTGESGIQSALFRFLNQQRKPGCPMLNRLLEDFNFIWGCFYFVFHHEPPIAMLSGTHKVLESVLTW